MIIYDSSNVPIIDIEVDDGSYRYRALMREDELTLSFSLAEHVELPVGAWCSFEADTYVLMSYANVTVRHRRNYEYKVTMFSGMTRMKNYVIYNPVPEDKRIKFDLTATPQEHLALILDNMNAREGTGVWTRGDYITAEPRTISYNQTTCWDALVQLAGTFDTEFEVIGTQISIGKVEHHKDDLLSLSYGKGNGLRPGISRVASSMPVGRIYIQGGDRNLSLDNYDAKTLHLPKNTTFLFDGEDFVNSGGIEMVTDDKGMSVALATAPAYATEGSLDLSDIYPMREGTITAIVYEYRKNFYDSYNALVTAFPELATSAGDEEWFNVYIHFCDSSIPEGLDYAECLMGNDEPETVIFQSNSSLAGREFNVTYTKAAKTKTEDGQEIVLIPGNRFEIEHTNIDGVDMPARLYRPAVGDRYAIFNCNLPMSYINDIEAGGNTKTGAEWDALREAAKYLYEYREPKVSYRGDLDPIFAKSNDVNVGDYLKCGSYISFSDPAVQAAPLSLRIIGVRQYVNNPKTPTIEFSNEIVSPTMSSVIKEIDAKEAKIDAMIGDTKRYAARSFRNAKETMGMLIDAKLKGFTEAISPIAIQTMQMLVGDESLQFKFWANAACTTPIDPVHAFDTAAKTVTIDHAYLQHMTLGIDSITPSHALSEYKVWEMTQKVGGPFTDPEKKYYLYAKCDALNDGTNHNTGTYEFSETAIEMDAQVTKDGSGNITGGYYHFLIGILNSESDGDRDFASLYGFTEVLPGQITTDKIRSSDGNSWFDMLLNQMRFGDANTSFSWNLNNSHEFRIDGGTIVQSRGNSVSSLITCDRGLYDANATYYYADEVYTADGARYVYINKTTPSTGRTPSDDGTYWQLKQAAGTSAKLVTIVASSLVFTYDSETSTTPSGATSITLTCNTQNIVSPTYKWYYKNGANWTQISGATSSTLSVAYNHAAFLNGNMADIKVVVNDTNALFDEVSLYKVYGGTDSISAFLTNTSHLFAAGTANAAAGSDTYEVVVFRGATKLTCGTDFTITESGISISPNTVTSSMMTVSVNKTSNVQNGTITVNVMTALNVPNGTVTIPVVVGSQTFNLVYSWALSLTGQKGATGAKLRGPTAWNSAMVYEDGTTTDFQDIVRGDDGYYYICLTTNTNTDPTTNHGTGDPWGSFNSMDYVATKVILSGDGIIENLKINYLYTTKMVGSVEKNPIAIQGEVMTIKDDNDNVKVTITSGSLDTGGRNTGQYSVRSSTQVTYSLNAGEMNRNISDSITLTATVNSALDNVQVLASNNIVTTPAFTISKSGPSNSGQFILYWTLYLGDRIVCHGGGTSLGSIPQTKLSLPEGTYTLRLVVNGSIWQGDGLASSMTITIARSSQYVTVQYPTQFTAIASDGARFQYGTDGVQFDAGGGVYSGAKLLKGDSIYNLCGLGLYGFTSGTALPTRIVFCNGSYPTEEAGVLYIKVSSS